MQATEKFDQTATDRRRDIGAAAHRHHDQYVQYNHEMTDDTAETAARVLIRAVPLVYGGLVGSILGHVPLGLAVGLAMTVALDVRMGRRSITLRLLRPLLSALRLAA